MNMKGKKIRACELEVYDIFVKLGVEYKVLRKEHGRLYYLSVTSKRTTPFLGQYMGANSQEWVLLVAKAKPSKRIAYNSRLFIKRDLAGNYIEDFYSVSKAAKSVNRTKKAIQNCLNGFSKTSGGFKWEYAD